MNARVSAMLAILLIAAGVVFADGRVEYTEGSPQVEIDGILFPLRLGDVIPEGADVVLEEGDLLELTVNGRSVRINRAGTYDLASIAGGSAPGISAPGASDPAADTTPGHSSASMLGTAPSTGPLAGFLARVVAYFGTSAETQPQSTPMGVRGRVSTPQTALPDGQPSGSPESGSMPTPVSEAIALMQRGDPARAEIVLADAAAENRDADLVPLYGYLRASLALERGDVGAADAILREAGPDTRTEFYADHELVLAHTRLQLGDPAGTLLAVARLRAGRPGAWATDEVTYLRVASLAALGELEFARQLFADLTEEPFRSAAAGVLQATASRP